jgi:hypothetical protein
MRRGGCDDIVVRPAASWVLSAWHSFRRGSRFSSPSIPIPVRQGVVISGIRQCSRGYPPFVAFPNLTDGYLRGILSPSNLRGSVSDHFQQGHQSVYVGPGTSHPYQALVASGPNDQGGYGNEHPCHPSRCLPLPFRPSLHSPLPIPGHLLLPPEIVTNHTRPFHEGKDKSIEQYSVQHPTRLVSGTSHKDKSEVFKVPLPFEETFADVCNSNSGAQKDGPSEPSRSYAHKITDEHFRTLDLTKKRKRAVRRPIEVTEK